MTDLNGCSPVLTWLLNADDMNTLSPKTWQADRKNSGERPGTHLKFLATNFLVYLFYYFATFRNQFSGINSSHSFCKYPSKLYINTCSTVMCHHGDIIRKHFKQFHIENEWKSRQKTTKMSYFWRHIPLTYYILEIRFKFLRL